MTRTQRRVGVPPARSVELLQGILLRHARDQPDASAVVAHDVTFTYGELRDFAATVATCLAERGVETGDRVGVRLENSGAFVAAALGCMWRGAAFVPISHADPEERVRRILANCAPKVLLADDAIGRYLPAGTAVLSPSRLLDLARTSSLPVAADPGLDAYIIYTSGTTALPKGVRVPRRALACAISTTAEVLGLHHDTRSLCVSAFHFDGSYGNLFSTLWAGGTVFVPKRADLIFVKQFFRVLLESNITHTSFSPSYLRLLLNFPQSTTLGQSHLVTLGLGGEECLADDLRRLWEIHPRLRVFNLYGPTETTIQVTSYEVDPLALRDGQVPIGRPHSGVSFHIEATDGRMLDDAEATGELYIGGDQLMTGYWRDPELTARVLSDRLLPGTPLYKTGDLVRRTLDGNYYFLGRADDVVKRMGVRISLSELARALRSASGARTAVCLPIELDGCLGVAAFAEIETDISPEELRALVARELPPSMIPDRFFTTKGALPLNPSGKTDRAAVLARFGCTPWTNEAIAAGNH